MIVLEEISLEAMSGELVHYAYDWHRDKVEDLKQELKNKLDMTLEMDRVWESAALKNVGASKEQQKVTLSQTLRYVAWYMEKYDFELHQTTESIRIHATNMIFKKYLIIKKS